MAINKRKLLASAQKNLSKGALDKALRDYTTILDADARDANVRLKVGDLHLRRGEREEAITAYRRVADQFMRDGFDAKAVALYKQITKIDPKRYDTYVPLAELYHRLGLVSDAMNALQTAADALNREGRKHEALDVLRRLASLDPSNVTSRLKVAELLRQAGLESEAVSEYEEAAKELERQGDWEGQLAVLERVIELRPQHPQALLTLARTLKEQGRADRAERFARTLHESDPSQLEALEVLAGVCDALDNKTEATSLYRELASKLQERGDEDRARDILQRFVPPEESAPLELDESFGAAADEDAVDVGAELDPSAFPDTQDAGFLDETDPGPLELDAAPEAPAQPPAAADVQDLPEGDPEQLMAEANVYLRYGKFDRAVKSLEALLAREPGDAAALEKLGEVHAAKGDASAAVAAWMRAADVLSAAGDPERFDVLRGRVEALDPEAAAELDELAPRAPGAVPEPSAANATGPDLEAELAEIDVEIEADFGDEIALEETTADAAQVDPPQLELPPDLVVGAASEEGDPAGAASAAHEVGEELEEASFYFDQGMFDEAEAIYRRVLRAVPDHPQALLRLGEIEAARGGDATPPPTTPATDSEAAIPPPAADEMPAPLGTVSQALTDALGPPDDLEISFQEPGADAVESDTLARTVADFGDVAGSFPPTIRTVSDEPGASEQTASTAEAEAEPPAEAPSEEQFDLAAALSGAFDEAAPPPASDEQAFDSIFQDFKRGVSETLGDSDVETRYDLGIAYREMGLYEDAISEFQLVLDSPTRRLDALHMLGLCALDLERADDAVAHLEQALAAPNVPTEREIPLRYDLGRAYEALGDGSRALEAFRRVAAIDPDFREVARILGRLERAHGAQPQAVAAESEEAETYESFDDLVAEEGAAEALSSGSEAVDDPEEPEVVEAVVEIEPGDTDAPEACAVVEALEAEVEEPEAAEPEAALEELASDAEAALEELMAPEPEAELEQLVAVEPEAALEERIAAEPEVAPEEQVAAEPEAAIEELVAAELEPLVGSESEAPEPAAVPEPERAARIFEAPDSDVDEEAAFLAEMGVVVPVEPAASSEPPASTPPEPIAVSPEPVPSVASPEPEPTPSVASPEPEPIPSVASSPEPECEPIASVASELESEPIASVASELESIASGAPPEPVAATPEPEPPAPAAEPVASAPDAAVEAIPTPEPEPSAPATAAPEPVAEPPAEPATEPEPPAPKQRKRKRKISFV